MIVEFMKSIENNYQNLLNYVGEYQLNIFQRILCWPTHEGFFFGSTEYDEYYFADLESTIEQLEDVEPDTW